MTNFWVTERHRGGLPARRHSAQSSCRFRAHLIDVRANVSTTQNCRFGVGRRDSARLAAIMLLIDGGGAGPNGCPGASGRPRPPAAALAVA